MTSAVTTSVTAILIATAVSVESASPDSSSSTTVKTHVKEKKIIAIMGIFCGDKSIFNEDCIHGIIGESNSRQFAQKCYWQCFKLTV